MSVTINDYVAAAREFVRGEGDGRMSEKERKHNPRTEPDPAVVAALSAKSTARRAHHEAGHAVAVIVRGGTLLGVWLADWSTDDASADIQARAY